MWQLVESETGPLYQQIIRLIEEKIRRGQLLTGERLPPERKLAQLLGVNRSTVVRAFDELAQRGVLIRKQGSGTCVNQQKWGVSPRLTINWRRYVDQGAFVPASPYIRRTHRLINQNSKGIIDLATGELPLELTPKITMPAYSWQSLLAEEKNQDIVGYLPLRESIQSHLRQDQNIQANTEQILITSGAQQALFIITQCLLRPGDTIAIESPSYFYALPLFQSAGLRILTLPVDSEGIQLNELNNLIRKYAIKMVFINPTFHNPTGLVMSFARRRELIAICAKSNLPIVEDNSYAQLHFSNSTLPPSLKQLDEQNVLYIGSLSKMIGSMTRIGWLVGPSAVMTRLAEARQEMDFGLSIFPQVLANHVINDPSFTLHLDSLRIELRLRRDALINALKAHCRENLRFTIPDGGFHLWCKLTKDKSATRIVDRLLTKDMLVMPGSVFGGKDNALRLSFSRLPTDEADPAAACLAAVLSEN